MNIKKYFLQSMVALVFYLFAYNTLAENKLSPIDDEQIHYLVLHGTPEDVKNIVESGYDVNKAYQCSTLLNMAVKSAARGKNARANPSYALEKIKILVEAGADINLVPCIGESMPALHWAISLPSQLQDMESDVNNVIDERIKTKTEECNFPGVVTKPCGDVTSVEREKIRAAIHDAMKLAYAEFVPNFMEVIEYLVVNGADINLKSGTVNTTPLHLAASNPEEITIEPLRYLIKRNTDINIQDINGNTPLFWANSVGNNKGVDILIKHGANIEIKNKEGVFYNEVSSQKQRVYVNERGDLTLETY